MVQKQYRHYDFVANPLANMNCLLACLESQDNCNLYPIPIPVGLFFMQSRGSRAGECVANARLSNTQ
jgi:hypothetical protein